MIARFAGAQSLTAVPIPGHAHHAPDYLAGLARAAGFSHTAAARDVPAALAQIDAEESPMVLILVALYLAGTVLEANGELPD